MSADNDGEHRRCHRSPDPRTRDRGPAIQDLGELNMKIPSRRRFASIIIGAALAVSSLFVAAPSASAHSYGCWGQTISIHTMNHQDEVYDSIADPNFYSHSYKVTVNWCNDGTGARSNGLPVYTFVGGWNFPYSSQSFADNFGSSPNKYVVFIMDRHTGALYGPDHRDWCEFGFHAEVRVNRDGSGSLISSYLYVWSSFLPEPLAECDLGWLVWSGNSWS